MSYTAVVLCKDDQHRLLARMSNLLVELKPAGFTVQPDFDLLAHHMTCMLRDCPEPHRHLLGTELILRVDSWGVSERALAMGVTPPGSVPCESARPHITVAVNPLRGGKPRHSCEIELWFRLGEPIDVLGTFREC